MEHPLFSTDGSPGAFGIYDFFVAKRTLRAVETADTTASAPALVSPAEGAVFVL
jgi:hypothetical protein